MPIHNCKPEIWGYFKTGDIIRDSEDSIWGNTEFRIIGFHGNDYCPMVITKICGKFYPSGNPQLCNLNIRNARLFNAMKRPLIRMKKEALLKLLAKGNLEAKREFKIRVNTKTLNYV